MKIHHSERPRGHLQVAYESLLSTHTRMRSTAGPTVGQSRGLQSGKSPSDHATAVGTIHQLGQTWHKLNQAGLKTRSLRPRTKQFTSGKALGDLYPSFSISEEGGNDHFSSAHYEPGPLYP